MDSLTHVLLGAATAQLGFRQKLGRGATWASMAAAGLPDIDIPIAYVLNKLGHPVRDFAPLLTHRGITHSLFMVPATALILSWLWWRLAKRRWMDSATTARPPAVVDSAAHPLAVAAQVAAAEHEAKEAVQSRPSFWARFACVLLAAASHPLLDWCTSYGTELLSPFSRERFALDAVPTIIDVCFTSLVVLTLAACWIVRRRGGEGPRATAVLGAVGVLLACSYLAAGRVFHDRAIDLASQAAQPDKVVTANAYPAVGSIFLWRAVVRTDREWLVARVRPWYDADRVRSGWRRAPQIDNAWTRRAAALSDANEYIRRARGQVRTAYVFGKKSEHVVEFNDMRSGRPADSVESSRPLVVTYDSSGKLVQPPADGSAQRPDRPRGGLLQRIQEAWSDLWRP